MQFPASFWRVPEHTDPEVLEDIEKQTKENVGKYASQDLENIEKRIDALDREWDVERVLEANAATLALAGALLATRDKKWLLLPAAVTVFLLQHALLGWCPPLPVLRRLGFRTRGEIDEEKFAFKSIVETIGKFKGENSRAGEEARH
ncbi:MAG: hypothetical protein ACP5SH_14150 [Syntrophobacteraceae bacterium]